MAAGTLYTYPENFRAFKAIIAAKYSKADLKVVSSPPEFKFGETNKTDAFLKKFPLGKVPAFESKDGVVLFESNAIAWFLANESLRGSSVTDAAYVQQWLDFADNEILPASCTWVFPCMGIMQYNKQNTERAKEDIKRALSVLNEFLRTRTFLVGERISLADICVSCNLLHVYQWVLDPEFRKPYQNVTRWFTTLVNQPEFKAVIGEFKLAESMAQFDAKKFQELHGGAKSGGKPDKTPKKEKEQKKEPKKEQKKEPKVEEEEDDTPKEKPSKDPFAALPVGTWNMDEWKRTYSNNDTVTVALPYFFEKFDKENYSIWYCEYKFTDELKLTFMTSNLVNGMFQRLDRLRKHGFGSMCIFGEDYKNTISGVWFWRGQDLAFTLSEDLQVDYESYEWKKLDFDSDETKKLVTEYFTWEGDFGGKKFNQGKIFK
jgi:elongation factor 1-gamma